MTYSINFDLNLKNGDIIKYRDEICFRNFINRVYKNDKVIYFKDIKSITLYYNNAFESYNSSKLSSLLIYKFFNILKSTELGIYFNKSYLELSKQITLSAELPWINIYLIFCIYRTMWEHPQVIRSTINLVEKHNISFQKAYALAHVLDSNDSEFAYHYAVVNSGHSVICQYSFSVYFLDNWLNYFLNLTKNNISLNDSESIDCELQKYWYDPNSTNLKTLCKVLISNPI